ncbi:thrombospondin type-1 domain-containing protein 4 [Chanos chanos]|uniref:Thrombospondin type-1 domain-containing protein 4 n=1 Tax=Chanos chanos TaxID=29144 RepID=A0A6J2WGY9_CHACN|nr:thrombospondin type-1 domain-containing protein 4-like [Chanos chanos]
MVSECEQYQVDVCGLCGGDGTSCDVVRGTFSRPVLSVGYHKILEIPAGAQRIRVQETPKTRNYLALRTHTGQSIINGNWVIDRPGIFHAAGTEFKYRRPNEIRSRTGESITALGPTDQELHLFVIYQQPSPTVHYEYIMSRAIVINSHTHSAVLPLAETHENEVPENGAIDNSGGGAYPNQVPSEPMTSQPLPPYSWVPTTATPCSVTCGTEEDCNSQPCPAFWDVGEWSECSKTCGPGFQHRQVLCRQTQGRHGNHTVTVAKQLCDHTETPETTVSCQLKICSEWQIRSAWTECSVPCGVGQRSREVVCVDNLGDVVEDEECNMALKPQHLQNCDMGTCATSWFYSHWSHRCSADCGVGRRSRSVVCLRSQGSSLPLDGCDDDKPEGETMCDLGPCTQRLEWYTGPWGQCSSDCGNGTQSRGLVCVFRNDSQFDVTSESNCSHLPRPPTTQTCHVKNCGAQWYTTDWSTCSRSCEGGYRVREVRCLGDDLTPSDGCDPEVTPARREECNTHICEPEIDESCKDLYYNCVVVVQARLCVYQYYQTACCASCSRATRKDTRPGLR